MESKKSENKFIKIVEKFAEWMSRNPRQCFGIVIALLLTGTAIFFIDRIVFKIFGFFLFTTAWELMMLKRNLKFYRLLAKNKSKR